ncbi:MAG: AAA family ATPase [Pyrinomonadaceae bacterium]
MARDDEETLGLGGDSDYDSMIGWEPESVRKLKARKKKVVEKGEPEVVFARSMNDWLRNSFPLSVEDSLFGPFWRRGELAVMFSSSGVGKSLLATQIAEYLTRGFRMEPFGMPKVCEPERVLYLDFELSRDQLLSRYSLPGNDGLPGKDVYEFSSNLIRTENYWNGRLAAGYDSFADMLFDQLCAMVQDGRFETLIVDNITFLDRPSTVNTDVSLGIMRRLNELKKFEFCSILVLAHTGKSAGPPGPLSEADLQGSVNICNFADSVFAMGRSAVDPDQRYLKQIKCRSGRMEYDTRNVPVFTLGRFDLAASMGVVANGRPPLCNFLGFTFDEYREEKDLVARTRLVEQAWHLDQRVRARKLARQGRSLAAIAAEIGVSKATAQRYVNQRKPQHARAL